MITPSLLGRYPFHSLPGGHLLGEETCGGGECPGHCPDAEDGEQHRDAARLRGQGPHYGLQHALGDK